MRVISGKYRGRKISSPVGFDIRPTIDRVKESMFNIIRSNLIDSDVLDLFSGTGSLGLEALSNGARYCCFVDKCKSSVELISSNLSFVEESFDIFNFDFLRAIDHFSEKEMSFDVIFLDPPYHSEFANKSLRLISKNQLLKEKGIIVVETWQNEILVANDFSIVKEKLYGNIKLTFLGGKQ